MSRWMSGLWITALTTASDCGPYRTRCRRRAHREGRRGTGKRMTVIGRACSMLGEPVPAWLRQVTCHSRDAPLASNSARRDFACCLSRWHAPTKRAGRTAPGTPRGRRARPSVHDLPAPGSRHSPALGHPRAPHRRGVRGSRWGPAALRPLPAGAGDGRDPGGGLRARRRLDARRPEPGGRQRAPLRQGRHRDGLDLVPPRPGQPLSGAPRRRAPRPALGARARGRAGHRSGAPRAPRRVRRCAPGRARPSRARHGGPRAGSARSAPRGVRIGARA